VDRDKAFELRQQFLRDKTVLLEAPMESIVAVIGLLPGGIARWDPDGPLAIAVDLVLCRTRELLQNNATNAKIMEELLPLDRFLAGDEGLYIELKARHRLETCSDLLSEAVRLAQDDESQTRKVPG